jgi:hypothetical protein
MTLAGKTDVEDSLKRLDILTQEEARMATAQVLKIAHNIDDTVDEVKRTCSFNLPMWAAHPYGPLQRANCEGTSGGGSLHQIRP